MHTSLSTIDVAELSTVVGGKNAKPQHPLAKAIGDAASKTGDAIQNAADSVKRILNSR